MDYQKIHNAAEQAFCSLAKSNPHPKTSQEIAAPFVAAIVAALKEQESQNNQ